MNMKLSSKGQKLIEMYSSMATDGYDRTDGKHVENAFSDFELRPFRHDIQKILLDNKIQSILDYGSGGSDWELDGFDPDTNESAKDFFKLETVYKYEPARSIDERQPVDCVLSFDVLEHIFISDVPNTLRDILSYANKMLILNIACYPAAAKLPNGENAHITVRHPDWWKGMVDSVAVEFPHVSILLICSKAWRKANGFPIYSGNLWLADQKFVVNY
jgi:hypothetical protein